MESDARDDLMSVHVKVCTVNRAENLENGNMKRDLVIVDNTGSGWVTIWGDNVGTMHVGKSYLLLLWLKRLVAGYI